MNQSETKLSQVNFRRIAGVDVAKRAAKLNLISQNTSFEENAFDHRVISDNGISNHRIANGCTRAYRRIRPRTASSTLALSAIKTGSWMTALAIDRL